MNSRGDGVGRPVMAKANGKSSRGCGLHVVRTLRDTTCVPVTCGTRSFAVYMGGGG